MQIWKLNTIKNVLCTLCILFMGLEPCRILLLTTVSNTSPSSSLPVLRLNPTHISASRRSICEPQTFKFCTSVLSLSLFSYSITLFFNWLESQRLFFSLLPMRRVKSVVHLGKGLSVSYLVAWVKVFKRQYLHQYSFDNTTQLLLLTARVW